MKVLQINSVINSGSTGRIAEEIGQEILDEGWESYVAFGRNNRESKSVKVLIGNKWGIYRHGIQSRLLDNHGFASVKATKIFLNELDRINPDIVHLHNLHGYYINIELLFAYLVKREIPIVWTLHDCWTITGHCAHFDFVDCDKWKSMCYLCPQKREYPSSFFLDRSKKNYELKKKIFTSAEYITFVPVSNWLNNKIKESYFSKYNKQVIHNGIDTSVFKPTNSNFRESHGLKDKSVLLGVASQWDKKKGLYEFIKLNEKLDKNLMIVLVGLTKKQTKELPSGILGISRTESVQELAEIYSSADLFVNPTLEDTFPTTNLEALACGTPIVTYKTGGSVEAVDENVGLIVDRGNINELVKAISILTSKGKSFYLSNCRKKALDFYRKEDRYKEYIELYKKIVE